MTRRSQMTDDVQAAAAKKKRDGPLDLMKPGPGTPWENRGDIGAIAAFFQTIGKSLTAPVLLADHIRRPETGSDVNAFVIGCGVMLSLAALAQSAVSFFALRSDPKISLDPQTFWENAAVVAIAMPAVWWLLMRIACKAYMGLVRGDSKQKAPPVLYQNVLGYMSAPIVLSIVPVVGSFIGVLWMMVLWIIAGRRRLYINPAATVIATIGTVIAMGIVGAAIVFALKFGLAQVIGDGITIITPPAKTS